MRGDTVQERYWGESYGPYAADGWVHMGDLGRLDEDGYLQVLGRTKDLIIRGGTNINPHEVEQVLRRRWGELVGSDLDDADNPMIDVEAELEHGEGLHVPHDLLGRLAGLGEGVARVGDGVRPGPHPGGAAPGRSLGAGPRPRPAPATPRPGRGSPGWAQSPRSPR